MSSREEAEPSVGWAGLMDGETWPCVWTVGKGVLQVNALKLPIVNFPTICYKVSFVHIAGRTAV